jgi:molybdenum cofactor cytidylyltransferase
MSKNTGHPAKIGAIVLAAGISKRMGRQKLLLPWKGKVILEHIIDTIKSTEITPIVIVTGRKYKSFERIFSKSNVLNVTNPNFSNGSMLESFQYGLSVFNEIPVDAILLFLGDQPSIQPKIIRVITEEYSKSRANLVVPSYQHHRGHPWLIDRSLWNTVLELREPENLRNFLELNHQKIKYIAINSPEILRDIDTPDQYNSFKNV